MWTRTVVRRPATSGIREARSWMPWVISTPRTAMSGTISPAGCASSSGAEVVELTITGGIVGIGGVVVSATKPGDVVVVGERSSPRRIERFGGRDRSRRRL